MRLTLKMPRSSRAAPNYTMLDNLKQKLDEIGQASEADHCFVSDLLIRREEGRLKKLSDAQFMGLLKIHEQYCR